MNTTLSPSKETTPSQHLAVCKLKLLDPYMPADEREYVKQEIANLKLMVEEYNDQWMDFGDGDLS